MNKYRKSLHKTKKGQVSIFKKHSSKLKKYKPESKLGRIKSRTVCRFDGSCKFRGKCKFFHPKEKMGNNMSVMESWAHNTNANNLIDMDDCDLFQYKLTTALTMMAYFLHLGVPITEDFLGVHSYLEEFINELKDKGKLDRFSNVYSNINIFLDTLKRIPTKVSLRNVLTNKSVRNHDNITLWRGFRSNYYGFLDNLRYIRDTLQTPIILATSLSENVAYRFTGLDREVPIIWKINIPRKELNKISGTLFEREGYNIDLSRPLANKEFEVILPMDSILKFKGEYRGKTSFESLDVMGNPIEVDISSDTPVKVVEWDFVGLGKNLYQRNFFERESEVIEVIRTLIPGVGNLKLKKKKRKGRKKKKSKATNTKTKTKKNHKKSK